MKSPRCIGLILILGMVFSVTVSHLPVIYSLLYHRLASVPTAKNATLSLSGISSGKRIILDGQWEFYWDNLIVSDPKTSSEPDFLINVPDYWSKYKLNNKYLPSKGFASYRLSLSDLTWDAPLTIYLPDFGSAYRVFIDGKLTSQSGVVSKNSSDVFTTTKVNLYPITINPSKTHEIVVEVATTRFSGLYMAPVLVEYESIIKSNSNRNNFRFLLFGTALFSFFILVIGYILSYRMERRSFWLPVIGLFVLLRIMMTTEFYSAQINEVRAIRHDFRHFVSVLEHMADEGLYTDLKNFLHEYTKRSEIEPLPVFCENVVANSILGYYSLRLKEEGITFHCACGIPKKLSVSDSDLCVVLGNGLENAMEACKKLDSKKERFIQVEARALNHQFLIKITNTYNGTINQEDGKLISTKETPYHGIGLQNIKKVVTANSGFVKTEYSQSIFTLMVAFPETTVNITLA